MPKLHNYLMKSKIMETTNQLKTPFMEISAEFGNRYLCLMQSAISHCLPQYYAFHKPNAHCYQIHKLIFGSYQ